MTVDCDLQRNILTVVWLVIGLIVGGAVGFIRGRRSHPVEKAAKAPEWMKNAVKGSSVGETIYNGPGGGRSYGGTD